MPARRSPWLRKLVVAICLASFPAIVSHAARASVDPQSAELFIERLWPDAHAQGVSRQTFDRAFVAFKPDPSLGVFNAKQPEFEKPLGAYIAERVTPARIDAGRKRAAENAKLIQSIESRFGVDGNIVLAIWGMETAYGASKGNRNVIRSLATLARSDTRRAPFWRRELISALLLVEERRVPPETLMGSWAGAMGHTQFIPSTYARFAVDFDRDGERDLFGSIPDALASTANYLSKSGWIAGLPWGFEVKLPQRFNADWTAPGRTRSLAEWLGEGVVPFGAARRVGLGTPLQLVLPVGISGPAFLVTQNFKAILRYNQSNAYALSVAHLADRIGGGGAFQTAWPSDPPLSRTEREELQRLLASQGHRIANSDGVTGGDTRAAIRAAQRAFRMPEDGHATVTLLVRLRGVRQSSL